MEMEIVKVSWSGGKDSSCALMKHIEAGHYVKACCYIPMFTDTIPLLLKSHYEFIMNTAQKFRDLGAEVYIVHGMNYVDFVTKRSSRGEYKGRMFGFPCFQRGKCGFKRDSKEKAIRKLDIGEFDYMDIGIAYDEVQRHNQLSPQKRSILYELKMTEADAKQYCLEHGILSPHYADLKRDGCTLCPNAPARERERWFEEYPEARDIVIKLQNIIAIERPGLYPLRKYEHFIPLDTSQEGEKQRIRDWMEFVGKEGEHD